MNVTPKGIKDKSVKKYKTPRELYALKSQISIAEEQLNEMINTKQQLETQNGQLVDELQLAKKIHFELLMRMSAKTPHLALPYYPPKN